MIDFLQRLGDAVCMLAGALCGNPCSTRPYTRRIERHYRAFKAGNPDKPESFLIQLVAAWLMSEWAKPETRSRWSALLRELRDRPTDDLKRAAVSIICIQNGVDERYWTDALEHITRSVNRELRKAQKPESGVNFGVFC